ncbi:MAG: hypothetical protein NTX00_04425 [Candidatus Parcubacteria bacterium]|nr:hypothetical protein [Candidatus Parcubacteria bacterium]
MSEPDEKFEAKDLTCPNCGKINSIAIIEEGQALSERYQSLLRNAGHRITKKGDTFDCQNCGQKIKAD